jgi:hypothetical protein
LRKTLTIIATILFLLIGIFFIQNYPYASDAKLLPRLSDTANIRRSFHLVINTSKPRMYKNVDVLDTVAKRIQTEFLRYSNQVSVQKFNVQNKEYKNVIASFGPEHANRIIIGAHYDVCGDQEGADDNASGVVGILELASLLHHTSLKYRIDLVAYSLEEPPFFATLSSFTARHNSASPHITLTPPLELIISHTSSSKFCRASTWRIICPANASSPDCFGACSTKSISGMCA